MRCASHRRHFVPRVYVAPLALGGRLPALGLEEVEEWTHVLDLRLDESFEEHRQVVELAVRRVRHPRADLDPVGVLPLEVLPDVVHDYRSPQVAPQQLQVLHVDPVVVLRVLPIQTMLQIHVLWVQHVQNPVRVVLTRCGKYHYLVVLRESLKEGDAVRSDFELAFTLFKMNECFVQVEDECVLVLAVDLRQYESVLLRTGRGVRGSVRRGLHEFLRLMWLRRSVLLLGVRYQRALEQLRGGCILAVAVQHFRHELPVDDRRGLAVETLLGFDLTQRLLEGRKRGAGP